MCMQRFVTVNLRYIDICFMKQNFNIYSTQESIVLSGNDPILIRLMQWDKQQTELTL